MRPLVVRTSGVSKVNWDQSTLDSTRSFRPRSETGICWSSIAARAAEFHLSVVETTRRERNGFLPDSDRKESMSFLAR